MHEPFLDRCKRCEELDLFKSLEHNDGLCDACVGDRSNENYLRDMNKHPLDRLPPNKDRFR